MGKGWGFLICTGFMMEYTGRSLGRWWGSGCGVGYRDTVCLKKLRCFLPLPYLPGGLSRAFGSVLGFSSFKMEGAQSLVPQITVYLGAAASLSV